MSIFNQRNQFYFDHQAVRLFASTMDLRPYLAPTGWVLLIRGMDDWEIAEYGIAYSPEAAQIHAEEAKGRYMRKLFYSAKYQRELNPRERAELKGRIAAAPWDVKTYEASSFVDVTALRVKAKLRAAQLSRRDQERLTKLRRTRRITVARKAR